MQDLRLAAEQAGLTLPEDAADPLAAGNTAPEVPRAGAESAQSASAGPAGHTAAGPAGQGGQAADSRAAWAPGREPHLKWHPQPQPGQPASPPPQHGAMLAQSAASSQPEVLLQQQEGAAARPADTALREHLGPGSLPGGQPAALQRCLWCQPDQLPHLARCE